jgi:Nif-specific regulatory protein
MLAYLVIREGTKWSDVYRLIPGQTATIGRAPTNQIVIKDERCSRDHAEVFLSEHHWTLRDLDSRNGTAIGDHMVRGDHVLTPGEVIRIGRSQMAFVHDLSKAFKDSDAFDARNEDETVVDTLYDDDSSVLTDHEPTTITHRRGQTKFLAPVEEDEISPVPRVGQAAATLCRLAFALAKAPDVKSLGDVALAGLFEGTAVDSGAMLLLPRDSDGEPNGTSLELVISRTDREPAYHHVSKFLATTVLREGEAVLARNVMDDSNIGSRDSKGVIHATGVICAPIRHGEQALGLIHLYSTDDDIGPDPDDLEFTLAVADTLAVALHKLSERQELTEDLNLARDENVQLRERLGVQSEIIGSGAAMQRVEQEIALAATSKATVLVRGESGVGKELVARAIHFSSPRRKAPFVCLNCAALAESLLASELFGHERGAFTGATDRSIGKFEASHKGTLMLDEIGEMSPSIQAKFLRVLEGHPFERIGGTEPVKADVRVIAATNRDLEHDVAEGRFRRDLYFRLHVLEILVPPLRSRREDIPELVDFFLRKFTSETGRRIRGFSPVALEQLCGYHWPGNVRELKNVVERAVVLTRGEFIDREDLSLSSLIPDDTTGPTPAEPSGAFEPTSLADMERYHILQTLDSTGWNKSRSAGILGIERSTLDRKIRRYGLKNTASGT